MKSLILPNACRGNSIATKAMEAYIKMVGEKYLEGTLAPTLHDILASNSDLEVDPIKVSVLLITNYEKFCKYFVFLFIKLAINYLSNI